MGRKILRGLGLLSLLVAVSCVTINIYFPAEEIRGAADRIVDEVWGDKAAPAQKAPEAETAPASPGSSFLWLQLVGQAYAAQDINVTTPEIRAIQASMTGRSTTLLPYLNQGQVGIAANGLLKVRSTAGLKMKQRGEVSRLVKEDNADRKRLYSEIARANGFPDRVGEVQSIFAESWRAKARPGWYLETAGGAWQKK